MSDQGTLGAVLDHVERRRRSVTVFSAEEPEWLSELFGESHVDVTYRATPEDDVEPFLTVRAGEEYLGSIRLADLEPLVSPEVESLGSSMLVEESHRKLREMLSDTVFSSMDRRQLLAATREIEDRAWRVGAGELHAGFQSLSALESQRRVYEALADHDALDVHVYGRPDWEPTLDGVAVHSTDHPEVTRHWFAVFDGGGDPYQQCAVFARQESPESYRGFWTYDPSLVDRILTRLRATA